jgi:methyl-accepting chemotaxis protein
MFKVKHSIGKKIIRSASIFLIVFSILFSGAFYAISSHIVNTYVLPQFEKNIQLSLGEIHKNLDLKQIEDAEKGDKSTQDDLSQWLEEKKQEYGTEFVYVLSKKGGKEHVVGAAKSAGIAYGTAYPFTDKMHEAFNGTLTFSDIYEDEYGVHKSGFLKIDDQTLLGVDMDATFIDNLNNMILYICVGLTVLMVIVGALFSHFMLAKPLTRRIEYILEGTNKMASGDLTHHIEVKGEDELSRLAIGFNEMVEQLREVTIKVKGTSDLVATSSHLLSERSKDISKMIHETASSVQEISSGSETIVSVSEENALAMEEITQGVQEIATSSSDVLEQAELASQEAEKGNSVIQNAMTQMNSVLQTSTKSVELIEVMNRRTSEIEEIATIITNIAGQINLLSLNAAIEAARAGEHGKGFAVVANEVRKLADQSAVSANQIATSLKGIQEDSLKSVESMKEMKDEVDSGSVLVNEAGEAFSKLRNMIDRVNEQTHTVSVATQQIAASTEEINASLEETASITENALTSTQEIAAATQEQLAMMEETEGTVVELDKTATELKDTVDYFRV